MNDDKRVVIVGIDAGISAASIVLALQRGGDVVVVDSLEQLHQAEDEMKKALSRITLKSAVMPEPSFWREPGKRKAQWKQEQRRFHR